MASEHDSNSDHERPTISIDYNHPDGIYNDGDKLEGFVVIHNTQEITIKSITVHCKGQAKFDSHSVQDRDIPLPKVKITNSETYFDLVVKVLISPDVYRGETLPPGNHRYNFEFQLPVEIPSTFVAPLGTVEYSCNVIVQLPGNQQQSNNNYQYERPFVIESRVDISELPNAMESLGLIQKKKFRSLVLIPAGNIKVTVLLNQHAYVVGDEIKMNILIENKYRQLHTLQVLLRRVIAYYDAKGQMTGQILPPITGVSFDCKLPTGRTSANDANITIPEDTPPTRLGRGCNIMKIGYFIEVALWTEKEPKKPPIFHFVIPVLIGTHNQNQSRRTGTGTSTTTTSRTRNEAPPPSYETLGFPEAK